MTAAALVIRATCILIAAHVALGATRRCAASVRALVLTATFAMLLALPIATAVIPVFSIPVPEIARPATIVTQADLPGTVRLTHSGTADSSPLVTDHEAWGGAYEVLLTLWLLGAALSAAPLLHALVVLPRLRHGQRWRRGEAIVSALTASTPMAVPIVVVLSEQVPSPGTCGILRPMIAFPFAAERWDDDDLRRVAVHEVEHIRRHDWSVHLLARLVCAFYWFHPLAWAALKRLRLEMECACDDAVVSVTEGNQYAEQLVNMAAEVSIRELVPILSVFGKRELAVRVSRALDPVRQRGRGTLRVRSLTITVAVALLAIVAGMRFTVADVHAQRTAPANDPTFEIVSVRPNAAGDRGRVFTFDPAGGRLRATNQTLRDLILMAYGTSFPIPLAEDRLRGGPGWIDSDRFTIEASAGHSASARDFGPMLQKALALRFNLTLRTETTQVTMYALERARRDGTLGPKLRPAADDCEKTGRCGVGGGGGRLELTGASMDLLAFTLSEPLGRPVVDKTGLTGSFDGSLEYAPSPAEGREFGASPDATTNSTGPSLFTALQEQFGLKLVSQKGPFDVYVIVKADKPDAN